MKTKITDMLATKTRELENYSRGLDDAVSSVKSTIDRLSDLEDKMLKTELEINEYMTQLQSTKECVVDKRVHTAKVIGNLKRLMDME